MARMNENYININEEAEMECAMHLASCLDDEKLEILRSKWNEAGGTKFCLWWKWCLDNISVSI